MSLKELGNVYASSELAAKYSILNKVLIGVMVLIVVLKVLSYAAVIQVLGEPADYSGAIPPPYNAWIAIGFILIINTLWIAFFIWAIRGVSRHRANVYSTLIFVSLLMLIQKPNLISIVINGLLIVLSYILFKKQFPGVPFMGPKSGGTT